MEWIQFIQEAPSLLEPLPVKIKGEVALECDRKTWFHALILQCCYCAELESSPNLRNPNQMKQWLLTIAQLDVGTLGKELKTVAIAIRHYPSQWAVFDYNTFKEYCACSSFGVFFSPVKDYMQSYLTNPSAETLRVLLQWTCFLTRITLETGFSPSSVDYLKTEERLKSLVPTPLWDELRDVIFPIVSRYSPDSFRPVFSNGSNSDSSRRLGLWGKLRYGWNVNSNHRYLLHKCGWDVASCPEEDPVACLLVFVPKGIDAKRAICEEPSFSMFLQQGILKNIDEWFQRDPLIKRHICLHDQTVQRDRARHASFAMEEATLDLSEASDSVSWRLVEYVMSGSSLFEDLRLTRTEWVRLPEGETIKLDKFAPMGSALCFPIECLIFLGICLLGCKRCGVAPHVGVYGDDLIVPHEAEDEISFLLGQFGFLLNEKKSFWGYERFKESCGGEYFDGIDVSPLYIPRRFSAPDEDHPELLETYTDLANSLFSRGYRAMRRFLLSSLLLPSFPGALFSASPERGIVSLAPTNFHLKSRWNPRYQRFEIRHQQISDVGDVVADDEARYFLTLLRYRDSLRDGLFYPEDRIEVKLTLPSNRITWTWSRNDEATVEDTIARWNEA